MVDAEEDKTVGVRPQVGALLPLQYLPSWSSNYVHMFWAAACLIYIYDCQR